MDSRFKGFIVKSTVISMVAFSFGTGSAWADEAESKSTETAETVATTSPINADQEAITVLPGDFFYFVKAVYERIQLAFAQDDVEEAILLAQFAKERLAESAALLKKGEVEKAEELLQNSLAQQQKAIDTAASVVEPAATTDTAADSAVPQPEDADSEAAKAEDEAVEPAQADKMKNSLKHNIVALTAALEKVENPQAQQSLLKNITKSFAKLEKKLTKLSEKKEEVTAPKSELTNQAVTSATTAAVSQETTTKGKTNSATEESSSKKKPSDKKSEQAYKQKSKKEKETWQSFEKHRNHSWKSRDNNDRRDSGERGHR